MVVSPTTNHDQVVRAIDTMELQNGTAIGEAVFLSDQILVMTPRPGRVARIIRVPFARPREIRLMKTPEFAALVFEIREVLGG